MAGNKGAVAIRMDYVNTQICFVTAHLAAGFSNYDDRNRDYAVISEGLRFQRNRGIADHGMLRHANVGVPVLTGQIPSYGWATSTTVLAWSWSKPRLWSRGVTSMRFIPTTRYGCVAVRNRHNELTNLAEPSNGCRARLSALLGGENHVFANIQI
jgi:hypothetical protein